MFFCSYLLLSNEKFKILNVNKFTFLSYFNFYRFFSFYKTNNLPGMSNDSTKVKGSTKNENIFRENCKKEELLRVNWPYDWQWCVDLFREREKVIEDFKKSSPKALAQQAHEKPDLRTVRPFPETSARYCGWLSGRKEFQLEAYGPCYLSPKLTLNPPEQS